MEQCIICEPRDCLYLSRAIIHVAASNSLFFSVLLTESDQEGEGGYWFSPSLIHQRRLRRVKPECGYSDPSGHAHLRDRTMAWLYRETVQYMHDSSLDDLRDIYH